MTSEWREHLERDVSHLKKMGVYCYGVVDKVWLTSGSTWGHVASLEECENPKSASKQHTNSY